MPCRSFAYPNILRLDWEQLTVPQSRARERIAGTKKAGPLELFSMFYEQQAGTELTDDERAVVVACIEETRS